jgi:hypothetical protein
VRLPLMCHLLQPTNHIAALLFYPHPVHVLHVCEDGK